MQAVAREYGWRGLEPHIIDAVTLSDAQIKEVTGSYGHGLVVISSDGPSLSVTYGGRSNDLIPEGADQFIADPAGLAISVKFSRAADGHINSLAAQGLVIARDP